MNINKYFFVIFFLSSIVSNQELFSSQESEEDQIIQLKTSLFGQYKLLLKDLDESDFNKVFDSFMNQNNEEGIHQAAVKDHRCIVSEFGQLVQNTVKLKKEKELVAQAVPILSVNDLGEYAQELYEHYQKVIGKFDEVLFIQTFQELKRQSGCNNFLAAVYENDTLTDKNGISKISSWFGQIVIKYVLINRGKKELERLALEFKSKPKIYAVIKKMLEEINTGEVIVEVTFIPELLAVTFEHLLSALDNSSQGIAFNRQLIDTYYDKLSEIFFDVVPQKSLLDYNKRQKNIEAFIAVMNHEAPGKMKQMLLGNLTSIKRNLPSLLQKELQRIHQNERLGSVSTKQNISRKLSSAAAVSTPVAVVQVNASSQGKNSTPVEMVAQQETLLMKDKVGTIGALAKEEQLAVQRILKEGLASFNQAQAKEQKTLVDQADVSLIEMKKQEQQSFMSACLLFLEEWRIRAAKNLQIKQDKAYAQLSANKDLDRLAVESVESFNSLMTQELTLGSLSLKVGQEPFERSLIDGQQKRELGILESKKSSQVKRVQMKERSNVVGKMTSSLGKLIKNERKGFVSCCLAFLETYRKSLEIESEISLEQLKQEEFRKKLSTGAAQVFRHNPYSFNSFSDEKKLDDLLWTLYLKQFGSFYPDSYVSNADFYNIESGLTLEWTFEKDYAWAISRNRSLYVRCNRHDGFGSITGKVLSNGTTFVFDVTCEKWREICLANV